MVLRLRTAQKDTLRGEAPPSLLPPVPLPPPYYPIPYLPVR